MNILFTGFNGKNNSSYQLVQSLEYEKIFLTNSFLGLEGDIDKLDKAYNLVVMFGLDKTLKNQVRIEKSAELNGEDFFWHNMKKLLNEENTYGLLRE